jgi:hypothetical protein
MRALQYAGGNEYSLAVSLFKPIGYGQLLNYRVMSFG